jgi:carbon monoxide dehydrogenase subunit G
MGIPIEKTFVVRAPAGAVWDFLTDPGRVARCLPGAAITEKVDDQTYGGTITVKVGPVVASYRGKVRFEKLDAASREAEISASGQETKGKGGADMRMKSRVSEHGPGEAEVSVVSDVNVVGVLAQFGRGMIQDVSDQMFQKFTDGMRRELEASAAAAAPQAAAASAAPAAGSPAASTAGGGSTAASATASTPGGSPAAAAPAAAPSGPAVAAGATGTAVSAAGSDMPPAAAATPAASGSAAGSGSPTPKASAVASPGPPAAAAGSPAAPAAPAPAPSPAVPARTFAPAAASEEVLDVGALGAAAARRAAGRTLHRPGFWLALAVLAILIYVFFFRR